MQPIGVAGAISTRACALKTHRLQPNLAEAALRHFSRAGAGRNEMRPIGASLVSATLVSATLAIAAGVAFGGWALMTPASAAPPTVTPSPGYDARLQQQHAAQSTPAQVDEPVLRPSGLAPHRHAKRTHGSTH
jgi:hypothetical protein